MGDAMPVSRRSLVGGLALVATTLMLAGHTPRALARTDDDTLVMAVENDPDGLDPQRTAAAATFETTNNIYDPLLRVDQKGNIQPCLATAWETSEDGLTVTFTLRDGVVFSNGNPCDAHAVQASFERLAAQDSPRSSEYAGYTYEATDDLTFKVTSKELNVSMLNDFAYAWSAVVDASSGDALRSEPVGTGPYALESWTPQDSVTLVANEKYWGDPAPLRRIVLRVIPDATTRIGSLRAGDVDLLWADASQVAPFEGGTDFQVIQAPMNSVQLMAMNCANEALSDVRVRQAINLAVDKDALIQTVWWGYGQKIGSHYPPVLSDYEDLSGTYPYDPDRARELLKEAGYADGLRFRMRLPKAYQMYVDAGQMAADYLSQVGIECDVEIVEWATWLEEVYNGRDYDLTVVGHTGRLDAITLLARYRSDSSENYFNYASEQTDSLIDAYRGERDEKARVDISHKIQEQLADDVPAVYIQTPVMTYLASNNVHGFTQYPIDVYQFTDVSKDA